jgi:serine/threonine-protein kinase
MANPAPEAGQPFETLGRYELVAEIASGGMATVYLGRMRGAKGFARLVAIKRLHPHLEKEEEFVSMFLDEARLAARIRHPNCVATLDVEAEDGLYIVMEYIEGDRLQSLIKDANRRRTVLPTPIALRILVDTLAGLHAAHEVRGDAGEPLNLVHRDCSPQNVLVGVDGVTRLTDFGIAKATSQLVVTREGQVKGKVAYMSPEQATGGKVDRRSDIFAMGIVTWEMLSAKRLFRGDTDAEIISRIVQHPIPRMREGNATISGELAAVIEKALERDPDRRYATASEFAVMIEEAAYVDGGVAPARDVAAYVQQWSGEKVEKERERLRAGLAAHTFPDVSTSSNPRLKKASVERADATPATLAAPAEPRARPLAPIVALVVVVAIIAIAVVVVSLRGRGAASNTIVVQSTARPATTAPAPPPVVAPASPVAVAPTLPTPPVAPTPTPAHPTSNTGSVPATPEGAAQSDVGSSRRRPTRGARPTNANRAGAHTGGHGADEPDIADNPYTH